ncbi:hypothetical protein CK203_056254 [Vitis vinifera]|uniref:Uncharacterized protein n=1 Tax=Vitis vinifera TaxID=29760 RepID=A0A438GJM1_VITVI|nr:hypothetical protein CK203_056254 [Vitis vinifera]
MGSICTALVINFVDYSLNQGAPAGHESTETPIGHESNGALPGMVPLYSDMTFSEHEGKDCSYGKEIGRARNEEDARVQAISQTPLQAMPCAICLSYEHLVEERPIIPTPPQYKQHVQALQQASNLEQAMMNLSKVVGDFVGAQKSINAHLSQRIDSVESSLNKRMDEVQSDLSQKIDNLQYSISRFANLNKLQEKGNFPSQLHQNSKGIHQVKLKRENLQW